VLGVLGATVVLGVASRLRPLGLAVWDKSLGDVLYTALLWSLVGLARPRAGRWSLVGVALGLSLAIEAFQLTGVPRRLPRLLQIAFGTTFAWHDVACYVVGALAIGLADPRLRVT